MSEPALAGAVIADVREALATAAALDAATAAAMSYELLDLFDHARRSTLKNNGLPNKRGGQKLLANAISRWTTGAKGADPTIKNTKGEIFAAMPTSDQFGKDYFQKLEEGGQVNASSPMVIPFGAGLRRSAMPGALRGTERFKQLLASRGLVQPKPGVRYLIEKAPANAKAAERRTQVFGFLIRGRKQRECVRLELEAPQSRDGLPRSVPTGRVADAARLVAARDAQVSLEPSQHAPAFGARRVDVVEGHSANLACK